MNQLLMRGAVCSLLMLAACGAPGDGLDGGDETGGGAENSGGGTGGGGGSAIGGGRATGGGHTGGGAASGGGTASGGGDALGGGSATGGGFVTGGGSATGGGFVTGGGAATGGGFVTGGGAATGGGSSTGGGSATGGGTGTVAPAAPSNVMTSYRSGTTIRITWTNNVTANSLVLERSTSASSGFTQLATPAGSATQYDDATVTSGTQYWYRLRAIVGAQQSVNSNVATTTPPVAPSPPDAPTNLNTSGVGQTSMTINWSHAGTNVDGFIIEAKMNFTGWEYVQLADVAASARSYTANCLRPAQTPYLFRVTAYNAGGRTSAVTANNTNTANPTAAPTTGPSGLTSAAVSANSYRLSWTNACSTADRILVEVSVDNGAYASVLGTTQPYFMSDATWFLYTNIPAAHTYRFRARAENSLGATAYSNVTTVGPLSAPTGSSTSLGIYADYDNTKVLSDIVPSISNSVYSSGGLSAGCFWLYNSFLGMQDFNCYSSAIHFPMSGTSTTGTSFNLAGRTIDRAILVMNTTSLAVNSTQLNVSAIASSWNTSTLTGNMSLQLYSSGSSVNNAPGAWGAWAVDVTQIVQNWANGSASNNGVLIEDANYVFPYGDAIRVSFFSSTDTYGGAGNEKNRPTLWVDSH